jgi:predicted nicotinamide N-methyase
VRALPCFRLCAAGMAHSQESQLVVFSYGSPFANAKLLPERRFSFLGRDVVVRQQCREDGRGGTELGFGAAVYDAAFVLADWLSLHDEVLGARVLELGCGVGLVSIACAALAGPLTQCVFVMTDGDATSVQLATENVERNRVSDKVAVQRLMWGPDVGQLGQFDVVLGTARYLLCRQQSKKTYLADPYWPARLHATLFPRRRHRVLSLRAHFPGAQANAPLGHQAGRLWCVVMLWPLSRSRCVVLRWCDLMSVAGRALL